MADRNCRPQTVHRLAPPQFLLRTGFEFYAAYRLLRFLPKLGAGRADFFARRICDGDFLRTGRKLANPDALGRNVVVAGVVVEAKSVAAAQGIFAGSALHEVTQTLRGIVGLRGHEVNRWHREQATLTRLESPVA